MGSPAPSVRAQQRLRALTGAGTGGFLTPASGSVTLAALTAAGTGKFTTSGSGTATLAALAGAGAGSGSGIDPSTGTGAVTLPALYMEFYGERQLQDLISRRTLENGFFRALEPTTAGTFTAPGVGSATLAALTAAGSGTAIGGTATGTGAATLSLLTAAGIASFTATASGSVTLAALTGSGAGKFTTSGSGAATLTILAVAGIGGFTAIGLGSAALAALTGAGTGGFLTTASGSVTLAALTAAGVATALGGTVVASGAATLAVLTGAGTRWIHDAGLWRRTLSRARLAVAYSIGSCAAGDWHRQGHAAALTGRASADSRRAGQVRPRLAALTGGGDRQLYSDSQRFSRIRSLDRGRFGNGWVRNGGWHGCGLDRTSGRFRSGRIHDNRHRCSHAGRTGCGRIQRLCGLVPAL